MPLLIKPSLKEVYRYTTSFNQTQQCSFTDYVINLNFHIVLMHIKCMTNHEVGCIDMCIDKRETCSIIIDAVKIKTTRGSGRCYQ